MDNNDINPSTGSKGVFPGNNGIFPGGGSIANTGSSNITGVENLSPIIQEPAASNTNMTNSSDTKTYIRLETKNSEGQISGILEIDLISFREKGEESRYLKILSVGAGANGQQSDTTLSIDNESDFNRFKKFISDLNWND